MLKNPTIHFFERDTADSMCEWHSISHTLNLNELTAERIWEVAREHRDVPHLGNIAMDLLLSQINNWCVSNGLDSTYDINAIDSHLFVNGESIYSRDQFFELIKEVA